MQIQLYRQMFVENWPVMPIFSYWTSHSSFSLPLLLPSTLLRRLPIPILELWWFGQRALVNSGTDVREESLMENSRGLQPHWALLGSARATSVPEFISKMFSGHWDQLDYEACPRWSLRCWVGLSSRLCRGHMLEQVLVSPSREGNL